MGADLAEFVLVDGNNKMTAVKTCSILNIKLRMLGNHICSINLCSQERYIDILPTVSHKSDLLGNRFFADGIKLK